MSKVRIYELAKKLNKQSKDILDELAKMGIAGKTHTSGIEEDIAKKIADAFSPQPPKEKIAPEIVKKVGETPVRKVPPDIKPAQKKKAKEEEKKQNLQKPQKFFIRRKKSSRSPPPRKVKMK